MQNNTKNKIISGIAGATMLLGGITVSDVAIETPTEKLETALASYDLTLEDITPLPIEKIEEAKESKDFTISEKVVLEAVLKGQSVLYFSDENINADDILKVYGSILEKSEINYEEAKDITDVNKLIRQKYD